MPPSKNLGPETEIATKDQGKTERIREADLMPIRLTIAEFGQEHGLTPSQLLTLLLEETEHPAPREGESSFDLVSDLVGCVSGGPPDLSEQTGKKFRQLLQHDPR